MKLQRYLAKLYSLFARILTCCLIIINVEDAISAPISLPRDPCSLISTSDINSMVGPMLRSNFQDDPKGDAGKQLYAMTGSTMCSWIAPPLRNLDTGVQRNVMMIVASFWPEDSIDKAKEWLYVVAEPIYNEKVRQVTGLGDEAIESSALFIRKGNLVFSVRFQPYSQASRDDNFIQIEGRVAELILSRL